MARALRAAALLLLIMLLAPGLLAPAGAQQREDGDWKIIVMPFFQQKRVASDQVVFLYAYERLEAVIDFNRNGVPDPGEPVINITKPGKLVYAAIGRGQTYKPYIEVKGDIGPLWILARRPLLASYFIYGSKGFYGAYNMPPPGISFVIPPMPGNLYITPATPEGANVTLGNGTVYQLQPGDYLVTGTGSGAMEISSDKPIAVVLVNLDEENRASFMTEIVPSTPEYSVDWDQPIPFPKAHLLQVAGNRVEVEQHVYAVYEKGIASWEGVVVYGRVYTPSSLKWLAGKRPGPLIPFMLDAVYTLVVSKNKRTGEVVGAAAVAVYDVSMYYESLWGEKYGDILMVTPLSIYGRSRLVLVEVLGRATINAAVTGKTVDVVIPVYSPRAPGLILSKDITRVNIIEAGPMPSVYILSGPSLKGMMARSLAIPIPASVYRESWPGAWGPLRDPGTIVYGPQQAYGDLEARAIAFMSKDEGRKVEVYAAVQYKQPGGGCNNAMMATAFLDPYLNLLSSYAAKRPDCLLQLSKYMGDRRKSPPVFHMALVKTEKGLVMARGWVVEYDMPSDEDLLTENVSLGLGILPTYRDEHGVHPGTILATIAKKGEIYSTRPLTLPQDLGRTLTKYLDLDLEIEIPLTGTGRDQETTTTTTTTTQTTTTTEEETATRETTTTETATQVTTTPGATETGTTTTRQESGETATTGTIETTEKTEEAGMSSGESYLLRAGDRLEYKIWVKASGPEGAVKGDGILTLEVANIEEGEVELIVAENTLPRDAAQTALLGLTISQLLTIASMSQGDTVTIDTTGGFTIGGACPLIGGEGVVEGEKEITPGIIGEYKCTYKEGILTSIELKISGEYGGQKISAEIKASLIGSTIEGIEGEPGETRTGVGVDYRAALAVAAAIIVILALLIARRR